MNSFDVDMPRRVTLSPQPFESRHFGGPVFRLAVMDQVSRADISTALAACSQVAPPKLVACRVDAAAGASITALRDAGFRQVETLVTYEGALASASGHLDAADFARPEDGENLHRIGRTAFRYDRFHADPRIAMGIADTIKGEWVLNNLRGRADSTLVVRDGPTAVGFIQCLLDKDVVVVDLIAVAPRSAARGLGTILLRNAQRHYGSRVRSIRAGTQENNLPSAALYRKCGMQPISRAATLHWMPEATD